MKKNIAAPRPLKRSGVIATVRHKYPRAADYYSSSSLVDIELLAASSSSPSLPSSRDEDLLRSEGAVSTKSVLQLYHYHHPLGHGHDHQRQPSSSSSADLELEGNSSGGEGDLLGNVGGDDEIDLERHIELEGSCEIQRIFLSGFHTPAPRPDISSMASSSSMFCYDNDDDGNVQEDGGLGLLRSTSRGLAAPSPSFQSFSFVPTAASRHHHADEDANGDDADGLLLDGDFPLLGHSPNPHLHRGGEDQQRHNSVDEEELYDEEDAYAYFGGGRYCPRAANPMPLNTPFHASVANDHPSVAAAMMAASSYYGNSALYDNSHHVVMSTRGHFYTLPASSAHHRAGAPMFKGAAVLDGLYGGHAVSEDNTDHDAAAAGELASAATSTHRTTRNRSYSEPIPFVPTAMPNRS